MNTVHMNTAVRTSAGHVAMTIALALLSAAAITAGAAETGKLDAQAQYKAQVAACNNGSSNQDKATCMKEATNALADSRKGSLAEGNTAYDQNALTRCNSLPSGEQADCKARIQNPSMTSGSASSGGVLRESVTRTVGTPVVVVPVPPTPVK
ncbi:MAG: hypothetical protein JWQ11_1602 [Rhizobacter sp.]|nr:hypothetical protein [Rhizobacter sp.]